MADDQFGHELSGDPGQIPSRYRTEAPDCEHRWLNDEVITNLGWRGFEPVKRHKDDPTPSPDSRVRWGDLFLCRRSKQVGLASRKRKEDRMKQRRALFTSGKMLESQMNKLSLSSGVDIRGGGKVQEGAKQDTEGRTMEEIRESQQDLDTEVKEAGMDDLLEN